MQLSQLESAAGQDWLENNRLLSPPRALQEKTNQPTNNNVLFIYSPQISFALMPISVQNPNYV